MTGVHCEVGLAEDSRSGNSISMDFKDNKESQMHKYQTRDSESSEEQQNKWVNHREKKCYQNLLYLLYFYI